MSAATVRLSTWSAGQGVGVSKLFRPDRVDRAPIDFFRGRNSSRTLATGLRDRRPVFAFSDADKTSLTSAFLSAGAAAGSPADGVAEAAVSGCSFPVMTGLGHGLQVVPIEEQDLVAVVRRAVIDDDSRPTAAGAAVLVAL